MTDAISSHGTLLKMGNGATPETFSTIAEVEDIDGPDMSLNTEDVTHHGSTGGWEEHVGTTLSGGDVGFAINYVPTAPTQAALVTAMTNREETNFQVVYPNAGADGFGFAALVTSFKPKAPVKGKLAADVKLKITGPVTPL